jgi:hypothetical protein
MIRYWVDGSEFRSCSDDLSGEGYREVDQVLFYSMVEAHNLKIDGEFESIRVANEVRDREVREASVDRKRALFEKMGLSVDDAEELLRLL